MSEIDIDFVKNKREELLKKIGENQMQINKLQKDNAISYERIEYMDYLINNSMINKAKDILKG